MVEDRWGLRGLVTRVTVPAMKKQDTPQDGSITTSLLKELMDLHQSNSKAACLDLAIKSRRPQPAELDQDSGGGYNPDGTFPQR